MLRNLKTALFLSLVSTFVSAQTVIFSEDFSDNHRKWEDDSDSTETSYVKDGKYYIKINESNKKGWHWFSMPTNISDEKNWVIETTMYVDKSSNEEYVGLLWGAADVSNMQEVVFYPNEHTFSSGVLTDSSFDELFDVLEIDSIRTNKIAFTLLRLGKKYYCLLNGLPVGKTSYYKLQGNKVGFILNGKAEISIDALVIKEVDKSSQIAKQILDKFSPTEEHTYYYDKDHLTWHAKGEGLEFNTKESSEHYRVFTIDDNEEIVGYVKEYDSKTDKLVKKFQAKSLDKWGQFGDVLIGEEINYDDWGNITSKVIYYNNEEKAWAEFGKQPDADLYFFNSTGKISKYAQLRDGHTKLEIYYDVKEQIGKIQTTESDNNDFWFAQVLYERNAQGGFDKVFREEFGSTLDKRTFLWPEIDIPTSKSKFVANGYFLESKTDEGADRSPEFSFDFMNNDFSIALTIKNLKSNGGISQAALILGESTDGSNGTHTLFEITPYGYEVKNTFNGIDIPVASNFNAPYIDKNGKTYINIVKLGKQIIFSINGNKVSQAEYYPTKGAIGLAVFGKDNSAVFSDLIIKELNVQLPNDLLKVAPNQKGGEFLASGSGFFISSNGYIVTNNHVIEDAKEIYVDVNEESGTKTYKALLVKTDEKNDLAILKISKTTPALPYSLNATLEDVGSSVFTLGYPYALSYLGKEIKFTDGSISSKTGYGNDINTYQISVPVQPGNSGGPLFDTKGNLVGVVNAKFTKGDNVSYAIKSPVLKTFLDLNPNIQKPTSILKTDEIPVTSLIKKLEKFVVLIKVK